jgi:hypothetical protein
MASLYRSMTATASRSARTSKSQDSIRLVTRRTLPASLWKTVARINEAYSQGEANVRTEHYGRDADYSFAFAATLCEILLKLPENPFTPWLRSDSSRFVGGCGRFFEGTAEEMDKALNGVLSGLPADTKVYDGHNYSQGNVNFALHIGKHESVKSFSRILPDAPVKIRIMRQSKHSRPISTQPERLLVSIPSKMSASTTSSCVSQAKPLSKKPVLRTQWKLWRSCVK